MEFINKNKNILIGFMVVGVALYLCLVCLILNNDANKLSPKSPETLQEVIDEQIVYFNHNSDRLKPIIETLSDTEIQEFFHIDVFAKNPFSVGDCHESILPSLSKVRTLVDSSYKEDFLEFPSLAYAPEQIIIDNHKSGVGENSHSALLYSRLSEIELLANNPGFSLYHKGETPVGDYSWFLELEKNWYIYSPRKNAYYESMSVSDELMDNHSVTVYWAQHRDTIMMLCQIMRELETDGDLVLTNTTFDGFFQIRQLETDEGFIRTSIYFPKYELTKAVSGKLNTMYPDFCPFEIRYYNKRYFDIRVLSTGSLHFYIFLTKEAYYEVADDVDLQWLERGCYFSN